MNAQLRGDCLRPGRADRVGLLALGSGRSPLDHAMGSTDVVPFLVETELIKLGSKYSKIGDFEPYTVTDGLLITGQNPASAKGSAQALLQHLLVSP